VLLADTTPKNIVVCEVVPLFGDLGSTAKGGGVKVSEDLE
jgi:hypothetical protein